MPLDANSIEVRWTAPESNNSDISDYDVRFKTKSEADDSFDIWQSELTTFTNTRTIITGLDTNVTGYEVQVLAKNEAGDSDWSESGFTNGPPIISTFTGTVGTISVENEFSAVSGSTATSGSVTINRSQVVLLDITASDADNDPLSYDFRVTQVDGADPDDMLENGSFIATLQKNEEIFSPPNRLGTFVIQGEVSDGDLTDTETITIIVENRLPTVTVNADSSDIHTGGSTTVRADIEELDGDAWTGVWSVIDVDDPTSTDAGTFNDIFDSGTPRIATYTAPSRAGTFRVTFTATETLYSGVGSASVDITVTVDIQPPGPPILISVEPVSGSHTSLRATWNPPLDDGGAPVTSYVVAHRQTGPMGTITYTEQTFTVTDSTPESNITTQITSLAENTPYDVRVGAINSENPDSPVWSNLINASTSATLTITTSAGDDNVNKRDRVTIRGKNKS